MQSDEIWQVEIASGDPSVRIIDAPVQMGNDVLILSENGGPAKTVASLTYSPVELYSVDDCLEIRTHPADHPMNNPVTHRTIYRPEWRFEMDRIAISGYEIRDDGVLVRAGWSVYQYDKEAGQ